MHENKIFGKLTLQELLYEFDIIECYEKPGHTLRVGEMTKRQIDLFRSMDMSAPT